MNIFWVIDCDRHDISWLFTVEESHNLATVLPEIEIPHATKFPKMTDPLK